MNQYTLTAGQMGRLFFRCYTTAGAPYQVLTVGQISGSVQIRQTQAAGGNWVNVDHWGHPWEELFVGQQTTALQPGRFIQWIDDTGRKHLYSIDVHQTFLCDHPDIQAIRLNLTGVNLLFVPVVHMLTADPVVTIATIKNQLDTMQNPILTDIRFLIDQIHAKVHE